MGPSLAAGIGMRVFWAAVTLGTLSHAFQMPLHRLTTQGLRPLSSCGPVARAARGAWLLRVTGPVQTEEEDDIVEGAAKVVEESGTARAAPRTEEEKKFLQEYREAPVLYKREGVNIPEPPPRSEAFTEQTSVEEYLAPPADAQGNRLMRVVVVGTGAAKEEAGLLEALAAQAKASVLVTGLYLVWDRSMGPLDPATEDLARDMRVNIHELRVDDPAKLAKHAEFLWADMLVMLRAPAEDSDFVETLRELATAAGLTFLGPEVAVQAASGDLAGFTELVEARRKAEAQ